MDASVTKTETNAKELIASLGDVSDEQLGDLLKLEKDADKPRTTVVEAIEAEQKRREEVAKDAPEEPEEPTYDHAILSGRLSRQVGYPPHVVAGALHGRKQKLTIAEAGEICKDWLDKDVRL
jgi:hypothetical protein